MWTLLMILPKFCKFWGRGLLQGCLYSFVNMNMSLQALIYWIVPLNCELCVSTIWFTCFINMNINSWIWTCWHWILSLNCALNLLLIHWLRVLPAGWILQIPPLICPNIHEYWIQYFAFRELSFQGMYVK